MYEKHESIDNCSDKGVIIGEDCGGMQHSQCLHYGYRYCGDAGCQYGDCMGLDYFGDWVITESIEGSTWNMWVFNYNHNTLERKIYLNGNLMASDVSNMSIL